MNRDFYDVRLSLLVHAPNLDGAFVTQTLETEPIVVIPRGRHPELKGGQPLWITSSETAPDTDPVEVIQTFVADLLKKRESLAHLSSTGHTMSLDISGRAETGNHLQLPPAVMEILSQTGMPLSVTVISDSAEDDMAWLSED